MVADPAPPATEVGAKRAEELRDEVPAVAREDDADRADDDAAAESRNPACRRYGRARGYGPAAVLDALVFARPMLTGA